MEFLTEDNIINPKPDKWQTHVNNFMACANKIEPGFTVDESNKRVLQLMLMYFTGDKSFPLEFKKDFGIYGNFRKGIMLIGSVGTGKSLLFKIFKEFTSREIFANSFQYYESMEIIDNVNVYGIDYLDKFNLNGIGKFTNPITCYIDDIGSMNETVKHYGSEHNVVEQLIGMRYIILNKFHKLTHISTNKTPKELKDVYGERITDRMKEMFNIIELSGNSRRE